MKQTESSRVRLANECRRRRRRDRFKRCGWPAGRQSNKSALPASEESPTGRRPATELPSVCLCYVNGTLENFHLKRFRERPTKLASSSFVCSFSFHRRRRRGDSAEAAAK